MFDDVRLRRCAPLITWVEDGEARLMTWKREEKLASSLVPDGTPRPDGVGEVGQGIGESVRQAEKSKCETKVK